MGKKKLSSLIKIIKNKKLNLVIFNNSISTNFFYLSLVYFSILLFTIDYIVVVYLSILQKLQLQDYYFVVFINLPFNSIKVNN